MFTNNPQKITNHQILKNGASDHLILKYTRTSKNKIFFPKYTMNRDFSKICWTQMKAEVKNDPRLSLAELSDNPNTIADNLIALINQHLDRQQPIKRIQTSKKLPPFATQETKNEILKRDNALKKSRLTQNDDDIRQYKNSRNRVHKMLSKDKKLSIKNKIEQVKNNPRQQWNIIKSNLGWTKNLSPNVISQNGETVTEPRGIAQAINVAHIGRNAKLHRQIPKTNTDPLKNYRKLTQGKNLNFSIKNVSMTELRQLLKKTKPTPSTGDDGISLKTLKNLLPTIEKALLNLVNTTIGTATYPTTLKIAKIVPLLKQGKSPTDPLSYRGINLLPSIGKIIDKLISIQLVRHLSLNNLLIHNHNGAIKGRSTVSAIVTLLDDWVYDLEDGKNLAMLILDQSAAYDLISHPILIKKLRILGLDPHAIGYFTSYLENRSQKVVVDTFKSEEMFIGPLSVCQGSTLSGLLYLIYTLDLPLTNHNEVHKLPDDDKCKLPKTTTFVDDSTIKITLNDDHDQHNKQIKDTLDQLYDYMNANKLVLNQSKSKILIISNDNTIRDKISIQIPGMIKPIKPTRTFTYLGIPIHDNTKWNYFIQDSPDSLIKGLTTRINAIRKLRNIMDTKLTKIIVNGIFMSKMLYGAPLWVGAPNYLVKKVQKLQLDAARLTLGTQAQRWSTKKLLNEMNWLPVKKLIEKAAIKLIHSMIHEKEPPMMEHRLRQKHCRPNANMTRMTGPKKLGPKPNQVGRTNITKYHFRSAAYRIYAQLPDEITSIASSQRFMSWVKKFLSNPKNPKNIPKTKNQK